MLFKEFYRPKLPRNKYGGVSKNHLNRYTSVATTFNMRSSTNVEQIEYDIVGPKIDFSEDNLIHAEEIETTEDNTIIIESETSNDETATN